MPLLRPFRPRGGQSARPPALLAAILAILGLALVRAALAPRADDAPDIRDLVEQVVPAVSVPMPGPDPLAYCRLDPAHLSPLPPRPDGRPSPTFHTCGARILADSGEPAQITGVSWFGMETGTYAPHGLWSRNWRTMLDQIASLGFNTIRLPFSNEALVEGRMPTSINYELNPDLAGKTSLEVMDALVQGASERGLKVILDRHRPTPEAQSELWYTDQVSEERWIQDWVKLARRYRGNSAVLGVDLHNEPRGPATWGSGDAATDWRLAVERAGNAVLDANPYVLVFVQGVERQGDDWYWWGGNLQGVREHPVRLAVPGRVVYSPHVYGPGVYRQPWFDAPDFPANLPGIWDAHWGYIAQEQVGPVVLGEFGGRSVGDDADGLWQRGLVGYLQHHGMGWINWSFNPNSSDTGGLLAEDWLTVVQEKAQLYRDHLATPLDIGTSGVFGRPSSRLLVRARNANTAGQTNELSFVLQVVNDGSDPLNPRELHLRYWFKPGAASNATQQTAIDYAGVGTRSVRADIEPAGPDGVAAVRVTFLDGAAPVQPYSSSDIVVRVHKSDWSPYHQRDDFSFKADGKLGEWDRVTLYRNGQRAWGNEPPRTAAARVADQPATTELGLSSPP